MKYAAIFPGQGSQKIGMGKDIYDKYEVVRSLFSEVNSKLGRDISKIIFEGPQDELNQTKNTQIAIALISISLIKVLQFELNKKGFSFTPSATCGHSLGEYSALWFGGVVDFSQIVNLVSLRGELMQNAPSGGMVAVIGEGFQDTENLINEKYKNKIVVANYNSNAQCVLSGHKEEIEKIAVDLKSLGKKAIILPVSGAFHSPLMEEPSSKFNLAIENLQNIQDSQIPIYQNIDGKSSVEKDVIIQKLKKQMTSSVYWTQTINSLVKDGVNTFIEIGPGNVLCGLIKKINKEVNCINISDISTINDFLEKHEHALLQKSAQTT